MEIGWRTKSLLATLLYFISIGTCVSVIVGAAAYPLSRFHILTAIDYNEGWNVYNALKVAEHQQLYPSKEDWTIVNYPALSFHLIAALGRSVSDYLFLGRLLSLISLCLMSLLVGAIVWQLTFQKLSAVLSAGLVIALFCAVAPRIVGMDDPQMLAQVFFLAGMYVYVRYRRAGFAIELTALLFVVGGNIKHNLIEFPLAVFLDLLFHSKRAILRFVLACLGLAAISLLLTSYFDGGGYISSLLAPRAYSIRFAAAATRHVFLSTLLPLVVAVWTVPHCWRSSPMRLLVFFFLCATLVDTIFAGGDGVDINIFFGFMLAIILLTGVFWADAPGLPKGRFPIRNSAVVCSVFFLWLAITIIRDQRDWPPQRRLESDRRGAQLLAIETEFVRMRPEPAICMDLLVCAFAGKSYLYDSSNADRYIRLGRLDPNVIAQELKKKKWGTVQIWGDPRYILSNTETESVFVPAVNSVLRRYYRPGLITEDGVIYVPNDQNPIPEFHPHL